MPVPETVTPPPGHPRYPQLDAVRALAALMIVLIHTAIFSGVFDGSVYRRFVAHLDGGVALFFVLSGFLLYRPFLAARILGAPRIRLGTYARRRFLRIGPPYWVALTVLAIVPGLEGVFTSHWWVYYGLLQNWPVAEKPPGCVANSFACGISPTWTLAIEVLFYASLPFWNLALTQVDRLVPRRRWYVPELGALLALSVVSVLIQGLRIKFSPWTFYSPLGRGWWFALGMGLAVLSVAVEQQGRRPRPLEWLSARPSLVWGTALVLYLVPSLTVWPPGPQGTFPLGSLGSYVTEFVVLGFISALLVLPAIFDGGGGGLPSRVLTTRTLSWLGLVSYGIFLWHFPILIGMVDLGVLRWWPAMSYLVLTATVLAVTIPCAAASFYLLERPLMRLGSDRRSREGGHRRAPLPDPASG